VSLDEDLADAINPGHAVLTAIPDATAPDPSWPETLAALEHALVVLRSGFAWSTLNVDDDKLRKLRTLRAMVDEWLATGQRPDGIGVASDLRRALFEKKSQ
jgi:hypothetical protein